MQHAIAFASSLFLVAACGDGDPPVGADAPPPPPDAPVEFAGPPPTTVHVVIGTEPGATIHVVFQDGTGAWQRATDDGGGGYSFPVATGRYGYGYTCADGLFQEAGFTFASVTETPLEMYASCGLTFPPFVPHTVSGHITGLTGRGFRAQIGSSQVNNATPAAQADYSVDINEDSSVVMYFARFADPERAHADRLVIRRDVAVIDDVVENVAFATQGADTVSRPLTVTGVEVTEEVSVGSRFRAFGGGFSGIRLTLDTSEPYSVELPAATEWSAGDRDIVAVEATRSDGYRGITGAFTDLANVPATFAVSLPAALADAELVATAGTPGPQLRASAIADPAATDYTFFAYAQDGVENPSCADSLCFPFFYADATRGWVGAAANVTITTPDPAELAALGAWDDRLDVPATSVLFYDFYDHYVIDAFSYSAGTSGTVEL